MNINMTLFVIAFMLYAPSGFSVSTSLDYLFETDSANNKSPLQNDIFNRDENEGIGARISLSDIFNQDGYYTVPVGATWTWRLFKIENEIGTPTNTLLGVHDIKYLGEQGECLYSWSNGHCGVVNNWLVWWTSPCIQEGKYRIDVLYDGNNIGEKEFTPTRFTPKVYSVMATKPVIKPFLPDDRFASKYLPATEPDGSFMVAGVTDNKGCNTVLPNDVIVRFSNNITPGSGGHAHFLNATELGTGRYFPLDNEDIVDPETVDTNGTVIDSKKRYTGGSTLYYVFYFSGDFGVNETVSVQARREATDLDPERKSNILTGNLDIKVPGFVEMPKSKDDFYFAYGGTCKHSPEARWVTPGMKSRLVLLDKDYKNKFGHRLSFNDASLLNGGRFDNKKNSGRENLCHESHRRGIDIDVNQVDSGKLNIRNEQYVHKYFDAGVEKISSIKIIDYVDGLANQLQLERVEEKNSIHYRYMKY